MWVVALDDAHEGRLGGRKLAYCQARDGDPDGACVNGLRWARNRGLHQLAHPATRSAGAFTLWPLGGITGIGPTVWAPRTLVQAAPQPVRFRRKDLEAAYVRAVRGRRLMDPLRRARLWLVETTPQQFAIT